MNDRQLRYVTDGLGGKVNGVPREDGFDITVASEIMAVLCLSNSLTDLKERLSRIIVGYTYDDQPVTCGQLKAQDGQTEYSHIPDWYDYQRECVKKEIENGEYKLDAEVDVCVQVNLKGVYNIGKGRLVHDENGFHLTGADGKLDYKQPATFTHTLYSDYFWYEKGDVIGIGDNEFSYFCFPDKSVSVTKARLATEELYKLKKQKRK
jgi:hypothetical protein